MGNEPFNWVHLSTHQLLDGANRGEDISATRARLYNEHLLHQIWGERQAAIEAEGQRLGGDTYYGPGEVSAGSRPFGMFSWIGSLFKVGFIFAGVLALTALIGTLIPATRGTALLFVGEMVAAPVNVNGKSAAASLGGDARSDLMTPRELRAFDKRYLSKGATWDALRPKERQILVAAFCAWMGSDAMERLDVQVRQRYMDAFRTMLNARAADDALIANYQLIYTASRKGPSATAIEALRTAPAPAGWRGTLLTTSNWILYHAVASAHARQQSLINTSIDRKAEP